MSSRHSIRRSVTSALDLSDTNSSRALRWYTYFVYLFLYAPVLVVVVLSFTPNQIPAFPMPGVSLKWYHQLLQDDGIISALVTSIQTGILAAVGSGIIGTLAAFGLIRSDFETRWLDSRTLNTLFLTPIVVPWIVTGIAVLILYNLLQIEGTYLSLVIGHILISLPFVVVVVSSQLYGFDRDIEEAAKTLGASELRTFYEVTLPLIAPGVIAGMMFAFTISFDNFTQTFFWTSPTMQTLPIVVFSKIRFGIDPTVNAVGTVIVGFSLSIAFIAEKLSHRVID
jgi:spermidine/putrescine transport system permease protein